MAWTRGFEEILRCDEPLALHTWFQLGGPAEYFAEPRGLDELIGLIGRCREEGIPTRLLGQGSNVLVRDQRVAGVVIQLSDPTFARIQVEGNTITAGCGATLGRVVTTSVGAGLRGLEVLVAIPGTLGGALHANVGAHGGDIGGWTVQATVVTDTGEVFERTRDEMVFAYLQSSLDDLAILEAKIELEQDDPAALSRRMQKLWITRRACQPMGHQSAGFVFRNPRGVSAGELIEDAGLKGTRIGGALVSDRHANFIVAEPECTAADVERLIDMLRDQVRERTGVELERELEIW